MPRDDRPVEAGQQPTSTRRSAPRQAAAPSAPAGEQGALRDGQGRRRQQRPAAGQAAAPEASGARRVQALGVPRLLQRYRDDIVPTLMKEFGYAGPMQVPRLKKIVLNVGMGEALVNANAPENVVQMLETISGQHAVITKARRSIAAFKLREGMNVGAMVTLRSRRMYDFLDRLVNAALPRIRDFSGVPRGSFDGRGNYSLGIREQVIFPEIEYSRIDRIRGMQVSFVTSARSNDEAFRLLELLGMPFAKNATQNRG